MMHPERHSKLVRYSDVPRGISPWDYELPAIWSPKHDTHARDVMLAVRHRDWGYNLPCTDFDNLVIDYDLKLPVAVIEYKHELCSNWGRNASASIDAITTLANWNTSNPLPFFVVVYAADYSWWRVYPMNERAKLSVGPNMVLKLEIEYVRLLYELRCRKMERSPNRFTQK